MPAKTAPPTRRLDPHWIKHGHTNPRLDKDDPKIRAWAMKTWRGFTPEERALVAVGLRALVPAEGE